MQMNKQLCSNINLYASERVAYLWVKKEEKKLQEKENPVRSNNDIMYIPQPCALITI